MPLLTTIAGASASGLGFGRYKNQKPSLLVTDALGASYSANGINWTRTPYTTTLGSEYEVAIIGPSGFVCAGSNSLEVRFSLNGTSWSNVSSTSNSLSTLGNGVYAAGVYAFIASYVPYYQAPIVMYSSNPSASWSITYPNVGVSGEGEDIFYDGSRWIVATTAVSPYSLQYKTSISSGGWTNVTTPFNQCRSIAFDGTTYMVAVSSSSVYTSTNLSSWTARYIAGSNFDMVATNSSGVWLAVTNGTNVYRSTNSGISWSSVYTAPSTIRKLKYSPALNKFIMSNNSGNVGTSSDGITWTVANVGTTNTLGGIGVL